MRRLIFKILKFIGFLAIGLLLLYFAFEDISFHQILVDLRSVKYSWIILSLLFALIAYFLRAYRWNLIIEPLHFKPHFSSTFYSLMFGYLANFAFPRIGEVTRCFALSKKEKIPVDKLLGTVIIERAVDLISLVFLLFLLLIVNLDTFGSFLGENILDPIAEKIRTAFAFPGIIWILIAALFISGIASYFIFREQLNSIRSFSRFKNIAKGVIDGLKTVYKMNRRWEFITLTILIWFFYLLMTWVVVFSIQSTSHLNIIDGLFLLVIGGLGMSAPVQGGIGAFHWIVSRGLATVYASSVSLEDGLVFATVSHGSQSLLAIILGSVSFILLLNRKKKTKV